MKNAYVIDTNLIFSALISSSSSIRDMLLEENIIYYAPNYIIAELIKHKEKMLKFSKLTEDEFYNYLNGIVEKVRFVHTDFISDESRQTAYDLCKDVDVKDTLFVALTIELGVPLWTGDKKLKNGLMRKGFEQFFEVK